ncbi:MAG: hypothetical protein E6X23_19930 [Mixta calida]|uniref:hypothetical protein n=1 Tax=Mixta calida TaxID=665913 RepID=UPI0029134B1B|nr:hypothetical protein [Mixta calida]MDU4943778.1 hypothetical protein [Mixta calida]
MEKIFLRVKDGRDITFVGQEVAHEYDPSNDVAYRIYETEKGHWLMTATSNEDILLQHKIIENKSTDVLTQTFGFSDITKSLYEQLGIDTAQHLDL